MRISTIYRQLIQNPAGTSRRILYACKMGGLVKSLYTVAERLHPSSKLKDDCALPFLHTLSPDPSSSCLTRNEITPDYDLHIIVPMYNVERYIEECVESILSQQTKYRFLLTIVNDGSPDRSRTIVSKYENRENVEIIDQENRGFSGARNAALAHIRGRYVLFCDSDDMLLPGAVEALMAAAYREKADIVEGGNFLYYEGRRYCGDHFPPGVAEVLLGYPCGKAMRATLWRGIAFPQGYWFEDTLVAMILFDRAEKMYRISDDVFLYRQNPNGISASAGGRPKSLDSFYITRALLKDRETLGMPPTQRLYEHMFHQVRINFNRSYGLTPGSWIRRAMFAETVAMFQKYFSGFTTRREENRPLEKAIRNGDYIQYFKELI